MIQREQLRTKIEEKKIELEKIKKEIIDLYHQELLLCDDEQWFVEKEETEYQYQIDDTKRQKKSLKCINW